MIAAAEKELPKHLCKDCIFCRGRFNAGVELTPALCWLPKGDTPRPVRIFAYACEDFKLNLAMDRYERGFAERRRAYRPGGIVFIHDGETFHSGMSYNCGDPEAEELLGLKGRVSLLPVPEK